MAKVKSNPTLPPNGSELENLKHIARETPGSEQIEQLVHALEAGDVSAALRALSGADSSAKDPENGLLFKDILDSLRRSAEKLQALADETVRDVAMISATNDRLDRECAGNVEAYARLTKNLRNE